MNKDNAHLYLPLVQALVEGKTIQLNIGDDDSPRWSDRDDPTFGPSPKYYRIKPASFAPIPDGTERHNPDNLTPEQVGEGWRLLTEEERVANCNSDAPFRKEVELWREGGWDSTMWRGCAITATFRVPLSTPYPDGSYIKDGKLVKPWVPKFKVGDRVKVVASTYDVVKETKERIGQEAVVIEETEMAVDVRFKDNARWSFAQSDLEPAPWSLSRHLPGFRPLRDGEQWHRTDWTEEMLPEGWRPLLLGEFPEFGDEVHYDKWMKQSEAQIRAKAQRAHLSQRTRRPLPEPQPEPEKVPLGPDDVPPGSVFKWGSYAPYAILTMNNSVVYFANTCLFSMDWGWLMKHAQIHRPGNLDANGKPVWEPCWKEGALS